MKQLLSMLVFFFLCMGFAAAQSKTVTGKVVGEDGKPLSGVSISLKGKTTGAQTDADGSFSLSAEPRDVLVISFVGHQSQERPVGAATAFSIQLVPEDAKLNEVVVVGYGTQSRRNVTSAISKIDKEVLASAPRANVGTALQGSVSGLQVVNTTGTPGADPLILLRGGASINNPGAPLVVVDGIIRPFNDIAAQDIESIELLKDAAATAIYGARANNGVILITTRQGKAGTAQITYKYTAGFNRNRQNYEFMNARDFIYYNRMGNLNSGRTLAQVDGTPGYGMLTTPAYLATFDIRRYSPETAGLLTKGWDTVGDPYGAGTIIFKDHGGEVEDLIFRNTRTNNHYLNLSGGNDKGKYYVSFDYYNEDGVIVGTSYKRFAGDANGSYKIRKNLEVSSSVNLSTASSYGTIASDINTLYRTRAIWPTFNPWLDSAKTLPNPGNSVSDGNPLYWLGKTKRTNEINRITFSASLKWDIAKNLYLKATGSGYLYEGLNESFTKATQTYTGIFSNPQVYNVTRPAFAGFNRNFQTQYNAVLNYSTTLADIHNISVMAGTEFFNTKSFDMQTYGTNAPTDEITTVNASTIFPAANNYSTRSDYRIASGFGRINYDLDQRLLLSLVFRRDGVSSLATDNRFGFFPGMSAGWNVHREKFFENSPLAKFITTLKPRVSYGQNGNVSGLGRYEVQGTYGSQGLYNNIGGFLLTGIANPNLRWEKSKTTDIGLDLGLFQNRLTVIFDYYNRKTSDLLTNLSLPDYTGFTSVRTNLGTLQNRGYEFTVNANLLRNPKGLNIDLGANASFVKNKILQLPFNGNENNRQGGLEVYDPKSGKVIWVGGLQEGNPLGDIYAFRQLSIFKDESEIAKLASNRWDAVALIGGPNRPGNNKFTPGDVNWMDIDKNDTIDSRDQVYVGNIYPKWTGGFHLNLSYKGFSLFTRFEFATGHTIYNDLYARTLGNMQGTFNYFVDQKSAWSPQNTNADLPKVYYADQVAAPIGKKNYTRINNAGIALNSNNSRLYEKGDYLAGREITLSYNFSPALLGKTGIINRARVYASGNNLFYITKYSGATPEPPVLNGVITGIDRGTYPIPRSFVLGLELSF